MSDTVCKISLISTALLSTNKLRGLSLTIAEQLTAPEGNRWRGALLHSGHSDPTGRRALSDPCSFIWAPVLGVGHSVNAPFWTTGAALMSGATPCYKLHCHWQHFILRMLGLCQVPGYASSSRFPCKEKRDT